MSAQLMEWAKGLPSYDGPKRTGGGWTDYYPALEVLLGKGYPLARAAREIGKREGWSEQDCLRFARSAHAYRRRRNG